MILTCSWRGLGVKPLPASTPTLISRSPEVGFRVATTLPEAVWKLLPLYHQWNVYGFKALELYLMTNWRPGILISVPLVKRQNLKNLNKDKYPGIQGNHLFRLKNVKCWFPLLFSDIPVWCTLSEAKLHWFLRIYKIFSYIIIYLHLF